MRNSRSEFENEVSKSENSLGINSSGQGLCPSLNENLQILAKIDKSEEIPSRSKSSIVSSQQVFDNFPQMGPHSSPENSMN